MDSLMKGTDPWNKKQKDPGGLRRPEPFFSFRLAAESDSRLRA